MTLVLSLIIFARSKISLTNLAAQPIIWWPRTLDRTHFSICTRSAVYPDKRGGWQGTLKSKKKRNMQICHASNGESMEEYAPCLSQKEQFEMFKVGGHTKILIFLHRKNQYFYDSSPSTGALNNLWKCMKVCRCTHTSVSTFKFYTIKFSNATVR